MATQIVADTTVGRFLVGDAHLATGSQADPVYPPGFIASICGGPVCGDGHVCFGVPSGQFGTVAAKNVARVTVGGVGSAQQFGSLTFRVTAAAGGVTTAQQFGVPLAAGKITAAVGSVGSAQSFGALTVKAVVARAVGAVASAQAFGTVTFRVTATSGGVPSAQQFGVKNGGHPRRRRPHFRPEPGR